jgi:hypothetical protein
MEEENNLAKNKGIWYAVIGLFSLLILFSFYRIYNGESGTASLFPSITFLFIGLAMLGKKKLDAVFLIFTVFGLISLGAGLYFLFKN